MSSCSVAKSLIVLLHDIGVRQSIVAFLTLRDMWNLFNGLENELREEELFQYVEYARSKSHDDKFDSFFEFEEFDDCYSFLRWCNKNDISVRRLFLHISEGSTEDIQWALEAYLIRRVRSCAQYLYSSRVIPKWPFL